MISGVPFLETKALSAFAYMKSKRKALEKRVFESSTCLHKYSAQDLRVFGVPIYEGEYCDAESDAYRSVSGT